jgi:hypothetical protein
MACHLSLISAAINLDRQLDHGPGSLYRAVPPVGLTEELPG